MSFLLSCVIKASLLLGASWLGALLLRRSSAAARHQMWTLGVLAALLLPLACWLMPSSVSATLGTQSFTLPAVLVSASVSDAPPWPMWLALGWASGGAVVLLRVLLGHLAARRLVRSATPISDGVLRSEAIGSPMTIGILRPVVLLPASADAWSAERMRAVLVHERGHVQRRDMLVQLVAQLACALYWWNPLVWLAASRLRIEREHACDDLVIEAGIRASSYAADLLDVARSLSHAPAGAIGMADRSGTETRLRRILDTSAPRRPLRTRARIAISTIALGGVVLLACTSSPPSSLGTLSVGVASVREPPVGPYARAAFTAPAKPGTLDLSLVTAEVNRRLGALEACYERRLAVKPGLSGTVEIHWVIDERGNVPEACITKDTVGDRDVIDCVNQLVQDGGRFPAPASGTVDVSMPFVFAPRATVATR